MRILMVNYEYPPLGGGGGVVTKMLACNLAKRHHEVTVLTSQGLGLPSNNLEDGVSIIRVPVFFRRNATTANIPSLLAYVLTGILGGLQFLKSNQIDVINTHFVLPSGPVGDALAHSGGIPNILSVHGGDLFDPSKFTSPHRHWLLRSWVSRLLRSAETVVGQSENTLANIRKFYTPDLLGMRIPLGIETPPHTEPVPRSYYGFGDDEVLLVTVGRLIPRKSIDQLIDVLAGLKNEKARLVVIGAGPSETLLREKARRMEVEHQVSFMGYVEEREKFQLLEMADIFVSTSQHEGFGICFLEAMHQGLPIVCYDQGGQTDFLIDGVTGWLTPLGDLESFRERCQILINCTELRDSMGNTNRHLVKEYYIDSCARDYEAVFEEAIALRSEAQGVANVR